MKALPLDRQVLAGFGVAMLLLIAIGSVSYLTTGRFLDSSREAVHRAELVAPLQRLLAFAYEVETAQRGFLFAGDPAYLAQRNDAIRAARATHAELSALAAGDPGLLERIARLEPIMEARFLRLEEVLDARRESPDQSKALVSQGSGRKEMASLSREINALAAEQHSLLRENAEAARGYGDRVFSIFFVALAAVLGLLLMLQHAIRREIAARQSAYSDLAQSQARQAELLRELQAANEELGNFAYVASHDLKAPLRAIGSLAHWISSDYGERFDEEGREQMGLLLSRVKRMDRLIDGILQYSRVGRVRETRSLVDLNELLDETVDLLAPPPQIAVRVGPLPALVIERTRAQQLFQNLIGNAIQYHDKPSGEIRVECERENGHWHFRVRDDGPGIEPRHWDRIFLMFQSLAPRDRTESTGLGLSLVKKIVEMHGGRIWVESKMHSGSTFHFTLPEAAERNGNDARVEQFDSPRRRRRSGRDDGAASVQGAEGHQPADPAQ